MLCPVLQPLVREPWAFDIQDLLFAFPEEEDLPKKWARRNGDLLKELAVFKEQIARFNPKWDYPSMARKYLHSRKLKCEIFSLARMPITSLSPELCNSGSIWLWCAHTFARCKMTKHFSILNVNARSL
ncbi:hypothetical protein CapIbe_000529 [Capra ibex]